MKVKTLYRLDHYYHNFGTFGGMFATFDAAAAGLDPIPDQPNNGTFTQVTIFTCPYELSGMEAWEAGTIITEVYFNEYE